MRTTAVWLLAVAIAGCEASGSGTGSATPARDAQASGASGSDAAAMPMDAMAMDAMAMDAMATATCSADPRVQAYAPGLSASSTDGAVTVTFVAAAPAPPDKGNNEWTVQVTDGAGAPIDGATITVTPYMPDHGHGSSIAPNVAAGQQPGQYAVTLVNLFMPGVWRITFDVAVGAVESTVQFMFCVEG